MNSSLILYAITPHSSINWKISFLNPPSWRFAQNVWAWGRLGALLMSSFCRRKWGPEGLYEPHWTSHLLMAELLPLTPTIGLLLLPWCLSEGTNPPPHPPPPAPLAPGLKFMASVTGKRKNLSSWLHQEAEQVTWLQNKLMISVCPALLCAEPGEDKRSVCWKEDGHMFIEDGPAV